MKLASKKNIFNTKNQLFSYEDSLKIREQGWSSSDCDLILY